MVADFLSRIVNNSDDSPIEDSFPSEHLFVVSTYSPWYVDITNYLATSKLPHHLSPREKRKIIQKSSRFCWIEGYLFYTRANQEIRRCVREDETYDIIKSCHDEPCGGHFADKRTSYKILRMGYYFPTLFQDTKKYVQPCDSCQCMGKPTQADEMPLQGQLVVESIERWALDFVGAIKDIFLSAHIMSLNGWRPKNLLVPQK